MNRPNLRTAGALASSVALVSLVGAVAWTSPVSAAPGKAPEVYKAKITELNDSGARSKATILVRGNQLTVKIDGTGFAPNLVHAQHIHGAVQAANECPNVDADTNGDGFIDVLEGVPSYGPIATSLTVFGDTSPAAALNLALHPTANAAGEIHYRRTFTVAPAMAANITDFHIVQHGIDINGSGAYDGAKESELFPVGSGVPFEITVPATCGQIEAAGNGHNSHNH